MTSLGFATAANAGIYASNPVYAGQSGGAQVTCRIFNSSQFNVNITTRQIITNTGSALSLTNDGCTAVLSAQSSCSFAGTSPGNLAFVCRAITAGIDGKITGTAEIATSSTTFQTQGIFDQY